MQFLTAFHKSVGIRISGLQQGLKKKKRSTMRHKEGYSHTLQADGDENWGDVKPFAAFS